MFAKVFNLAQAHPHLDAAVKVEVLPDRAMAPGEVRIPDRRTLVVGCGAGALKLLALTPESSKTMDAAAFLNGLRGEEIGFPFPGD